MTPNIGRRGLVVAASHSGAGKTTVTAGLLRAFARRGVRVQPFKCGPDYIDPAFHAVAAGRPSYNLDTWAMAPATIADLVSRHAATAADLAIVEGVMGLFDGVADPGQTARGSTADLAALLGWPVVLVLDVAGQTETAAAVAAGCAHYRDDVSIAGVILNRVASPRHAALIAPGFARIGIPLFGAMTEDAHFTLPERHLGLVQASETADLDRRLDRLAAMIEASVDLDAVHRSAAATGFADSAGARFDPPGQRIALAQDRAFSFMYPHLLDRWRSAGAEILAFSPLADQAPDPTADAVWLPGGYPELHAGTLAAAHRFHQGLRVLADRAVPIHGECGGYMVLGQGIEDAAGQRHAMTGLLRLETSFAQRRMHLGYRRARRESRVPAGRGGNRGLGPRVPLCQRTLERRRAIGRVPRCDRRPGRGRRRAARVGERHVLSFHRQATGMTATFDAAFRAQFRNLVLWRRDVRRFRSDPIARERIDALLEIASHAPSVGLSQPWRFVHVNSAERRLAVVKSFTDANEQALAGYSGEKQAIYAGLKLAGLKEAPVHLAVFSDDATHTGSGLGQQTMPETLHYSVVAAIQTLWLAARADGIGMGWVSILDPKAVTRVLDVPKSWSLVAYLNLGLPAEEHLDPELERHHWEVRADLKDVVFTR